MKATVIGCMHMAGIGKESKKPYNMARLTLLSPLDSIKTDTMTRDAAGFEIVEVDLALEAVPHFLSQKYPAQFDLETDMQVRAGKMQTIVTGLKKAA